MQWIEDAGLISSCRNLELPELPLAGNATTTSKVSIKGIGLFTAMPEDGTRFDVYKTIYTAIKANLVADVFAKKGRKLYYYRKVSG